jgi:hypothetical protein
MVSLSTRAPAWCPGDAKLLVHGGAAHGLGGREPAREQLLVGGQHARGLLEGLADELHPEAAHAVLQQLGTSEAALWACALKTVLRQPTSTMTGAPAPACPLSESWCFSQGRPQVR